jgi:hypothetical protein
MSIAQPSANQIANIYQGNPGALNARIQQEQKGKPAGLPPDLTKLMALNINVNEQDAVKRQQAMAALQSMQKQSGGELPTVAQTIQQQAAQKAQIMQQQMQQMQPKPQGLMALLQQRGMPQAPENAPRPDRQPSGIDELSSNVGEHFDGGGIVAFKTGDEVKDPNAESSQFVQDIAKIPEAFDDLKKRAREEDAIRAAQDRRMADRKKEMLEARGKTSLFNYFFGSPAREKEGLEKLTELSNAPLPAKAEAPAPVSGPSNRALLNAADADLRGLPAAIKKETPPVVNQQPPKPAAPAAPPKPTAPVAPAEKSSREKFFDSMLEKTPDERRDEALRRYKETIGDPDVSAQERYIKQLEESRARFQEPTDFAGRLSAWARNTANAGGRSSLETGSRGAAASEAERRSMAQKDIELLKELMAESSKVADIKRGYKKEVFAFGEGEYKEAYRNGLEVAKEMGLDDRQQKLFAHQSAENALQRANAIKVAGMPTGDQRQFKEIAADWLSKPENKGKTISDAFNAFNISKQGAKPEQSRAAMIEKYVDKWNNMEIMEKANLKKEGVNSAEDYVARMLRITEQYRPGATSASTSGKVPAPPSGFKLD